MLSAVCIGTNDIASASDFYNKVLGTIGMRCVFRESHEMGYAGSDGKITVYVVIPFNEQKATFGNGTQFMFYAQDKEAVHAFHAMALQCGGSNEGLPGPRDYHPDYYGAYVRDPDGNKLHVSLDISDSLNV